MSTTLVIQILISPHGTGTVKVPSVMKIEYRFTTDSLATSFMLTKLHKVLDAKPSCRVATINKLIANLFKCTTVAATLTQVQSCIIN